MNEKVKVEFKPHEHTKLSIASILNNCYVITIM